jgi:hypothetical protein
VTDNDVRRLASSITTVAKGVLGRHDQQCVMALIAYFDGSGSEADRGSTAADAIAVAGFFGTEHQWAKLERTWPQMLSKYGLANLDTARIVYLAKNEKEGWNRERANALFHHVRDILSGCKLKGASSTVLLADYETVNREYLLREHLAGPYALSVQSNLHAIGQIMRPRHARDISDRNRCVNPTFPR